LYLECIRCIAPPSGNYLPIFAIYLGYSDSYLTLYRYLQFSELIESETARVR